MTRILLITALALVLAVPAHAADGRLTKAQYQAQLSAGNQRVTEATAPFERARHLTRAQLISGLYAWERAERSGAARLTAIAFTREMAASPGPRELDAAVAELHHLGYEDLG